MTSAIYPRPATRLVAIVATFAVVYFIFRMIPTFAMVGVSGGTFSLADVVAPLYGIILGPYAGALSVTLGTILAIAFGRPMVFLGLDFLPGAVDALTVGLLLRGKRLAATALYVALFIAFLFHPYTAVFVPVPIRILNLDSFFYSWLHLIALLVLVSPLSKKAAEWVKGASLVNLAPGILTLTFIGTLAQHLMGGLLYETILGMFVGKAPEAFRLFWNTVFWLYPFERTFIVGLATIIGVPLVRALKSSGFLISS
jgi:hypothetical protein